MERSKVVELSSGRYRVDKMTARNACWIVTQLLTKMMPSAVETNIDFNLPQNRAEMSEQEFHNIQDHCLRVCYLIENQPSGVPAALPIMAEGTWAVPDIEHDIITVLLLTIHALTFSVAPFFEGDVLKSALGSLSDLKLFNTSK